uniref:Diacylglycerol kinase n=1 Tax=Knipowitschia caucasica TaxID=637954 RepID=A0AAV2M3F8_KNICA
MASSAETESSLTPVDFIQLQHYMDDSNKRVKDVIKHFHPGGKLAQHTFGECLDEGGFSLFMKTYLDVRDVPSDFCKRLFGYFKHTDHNGAGSCQLQRGEVSRDEVTKVPMCSFLLRHPSPPTPITSDTHHLQHPSPLAPITSDTHHFRHPSPPTPITSDTHHLRHPSPPTPITSDTHHLRHPSPPTPITSNTHHLRHPSPPTPITSDTHHFRHSSPPTPITSDTHHLRHPSLPTLITSDTHHLRHPSPPTPITSDTHHLRHPSPPTPITSDTHHLQHPSLPTPITSDTHHLRHPSPPTPITSDTHHFRHSSPPTPITSDTHHLRHPSPPTPITSDTHHLRHPSPPTPITSDTHHLQHPSPPTPITSNTHHLRHPSPPTPITSNTHHLRHPSPPTPITSNTHHLQHPSPPTPITSNTHHLRHPSPHYIPTKLRDFISLTTYSGVFLRDVSCYFSVLEDGQPRDKLEFTFKLYDKDNNGLLDSSEVDRIITQMMRAANYLGWDVTEIKPMLKDMMKAIDVDDSGTVTLEEWVKGGMNNVPLLVLLGLKMVEKDGQHTWRMQHFNKPTYCAVCESMLLGLAKQGLCCTCCKYTVHNQCANKNPEPCARTYVKSKNEIGVPSHEWIRADCKSNKCEVCHKKIKALGGRSCIWCHELRHDECVVIGIKRCDCGAQRDHILPPWAIFPASVVAQAQARPLRNRLGQPNATV